MVVCTSGGGIAAAYWTTLCLAELEEKVPKFPSHLRLVTGSSGGMLGAGLYVASLEAPDQPNQPKPEDRLRDLKGVWKNCDFLTPVVRQMVFRDLPSTFCTKELMPPYFKKDGISRTEAGRWKSSGRAYAWGRASRADCPTRSPSWLRAKRRSAALAGRHTDDRRTGPAALDQQSGLPQQRSGNPLQQHPVLHALPRPGRYPPERSQIARQKVVESLRLSTAIR